MSLQMHRCYLFVSPFMLYWTVISIKSFSLSLSFFVLFFVINSNMTKYAKIQIKTILCLIICLHCLKLSFGVLIYIAL